MNTSLSIYLDLARFIAALLVFLFHAKYARFDGNWLKEFGAYGHDAVMIFFVLSGFVIAYISNHKEHTVGAFTKSRLARLYSVVLPALLLTLLADAIGKLVDPSMYNGTHYQNSQPIVRFFVNVFFVNELWFSSWKAFSNEPFWSLSYEFWYYAIYALFFYFSGWRRYVFSVVACLIAGPKILILFPVWLFGVLIYHLSARTTPGLFASICLAILPFALYYVYRDMNIHKYLLRETVEFLGRNFVFNDLKWSRRFISDYLVGGLFSAHIIGMVSLTKKVIIPQIAEKPIRYFAGMTFTLYLLHFPLLQLYGSIVNNGFFIVTLTFISVILLAPVTEGKKKELRRIIEGISGPKRAPSG